MKILFFSPRFYPQIGGVEKHAYFISRELKREGHTIDVITEKFGTEKKFEIFDDVSVVRLNFRGKSWFKKFRIWKEIWQQRKLIEDADIVHCHDVFIWYLPFRFLFPFKKVYITFHGYEGKFPPSQKAVLIRKVSEKLSSGNICVGSFIKKWYRTKANFITYGGVDTIPSSRFTVHSINTKLKIAFLGRIEQDNNVLSFARMLERLRKDKVHFDFTAVGDGSLRSYFEQFGTVTGFVQDVSKYIEKADIVFTASYLSILESLAQKKIVVSLYDNPLKRDYLQNSPFAKYCIMGPDEDELVHKIEYYYRHRRELEAFVEKGYDFAKKQTWGSVAKLYHQLWKI